MSFPHSYPSLSAIASEFLMTMILGTTSSDELLDAGSNVDALNASMLLASPPCNSTKTGSSCVVTLPHAALSPSRTMEEVATEQLSPLNSFLKKEIAVRYSWVPFVAAGLYLLMCAGLKALMRKREKPFHFIRYVNIMWYSLRCCFCLAGIVTVVPEYLSAIWRFGSPVGFFFVPITEFVQTDLAITMTLLLGLSKVPLLVDSAFTILLKKPVNRFTMVHHPVSAIVVWFACTSLTGWNLYGTALHFCVNFYTSALFLWASVTGRSAYSVKLMYLLAAECLTPILLAPPFLFVSYNYPHLYVNMPVGLLTAFGMLAIGLMYVVEVKKRTCRRQREPSSPCTYQDEPRRKTTTQEE